MKVVGPKWLNYFQIVGQPTTVSTMQKYENHLESGFPW